SETKISTTIHKGKSKILRYNTVWTDPIKIDGDDLEDVKTFTYLSNISDEHGGSDADVKSRTGKTRAAYLQLKNIGNFQSLLNIFLNMFSDCFKQRKDSQFFHIFNDYRLNIKILFSSLIIIMLITWSIFYVIIPNKTSTTTTNNYNGIDPFNTNNPLFDSELVFVETLDITITTRMFTNWTFKRRLLIDLKQNDDKFC
ncbi:unnamed protein product, partial [Schistosoma margrebowiei]